MKNLKYIIVLVLFLMTMSLHAQDNNSLQGAIEKGKSDLIEILTTPGNQFNFDISADEVKQAQPASAIPNKEMNFEGLLKYDEQQDVSRLLSKTQKLVVPLVVGSNVVTTISVVGTDQKNYKVGELINHQYHNELNQLPNEIKRSNFKNINIVYVPNLNVNIYMDNDAKSYTSYKGHSIREGVSTQELVRELKDDAIIFQKKYADQLKSGKLLN